MTPEAYKQAIAKLGLPSQEEAGLWLGVSVRTGQNYARHGPPKPIAKLITMMLRLKLKKEDLR